MLRETVRDWPGDWMAVSERFRARDCGNFGPSSFGFVELLRLPCPSHTPRTALEYSINVKPPPVFRIPFCCLRRFAIARNPSKHIQLVQSLARHMIQ